MTLPTFGSTQGALSVPVEHRVHCGGAIRDGDPYAWALT